jgi:hypothetical protein
MNATTKEELTRIAQEMAPAPFCMRTTDFHARAPKYPAEPDSVCYQMAKEEICRDIEAFASFIEIAEGEREPAAYFGLISSVELAEILLNERATDEQLAQAARELRKRFLQDNVAELQRLAFKFSEE